METKLVSVLMPVFNGEKFLKNAINSIIKQTYSNFEFVIINDGSTDSTAKILSEFEKTDNRIKIITLEKNVGLIQVLNQGIKICKGDYIARMDADDESHKDRLHDQINFLEKNTTIDICGTQTQFSTRNKVYAKKHLNSNEIKARLLFDNILSHPTITFRKHFFENKELVYDKTYLHAEDYSLWLQNISSANFSIVNKVLLTYNTHDTQVSKIFNSVQKENVIKIQNILFKQLQIEATPEEQELHFSLFSSNVKWEKDIISKIENWLLKLKEGNNKAKFFESESFNNIISWTWFEACTHLIKHDKTIYKQFYLSGNYKSNTINPIYLLKFFLKKF